MTSHLQTTHPSDLASDLDRAFAAMNARPDDETLAMQFYQTLAQTPLFLVLDQEVAGDTVTPRLFDLPSGALVLAFETEDLLGAWTQDAGQVPYAVLPGRIIAQQLAGLGREIALGLNFGGASEVILPHAAMGWLAEMLDVAPQSVAARIVHVAAPQGLPDALTAALRRALPLGTRAFLGAVKYDNGAMGHVLAVLDSAAEDPIARAIAESLGFSGLEAGVLDVTFVAGNSPLAAKMQQFGLDFSTAMPTAPQTDSEQTRPAPGSDPAKPPKLR